MIKPTLVLGFVGLSALALAALTTAANAQEKVRWKMQSAFGSQLPHLGTSAVRFAKNVERLSGGKLEIKFYEPGALIPPLECFDAVSKGSIESCWTTPGYHTGKYPALAFFTTVPFGPPITDNQSIAIHALGTKCATTGIDSCRLWRAGEIAQYQNAESLRLIRNARSKS